jgi:hypothetical protein
MMEFRYDPFAYRHRLVGAANLQSSLRHCTNVAMTMVHSHSHCRSLGLAQLIGSSRLSSGQGEVPPGWLSGGASLLAWIVLGRSFSCLCDGESG